MRRHRDGAGTADPRFVVVGFPSWAEVLSETPPLAVAADSAASSNKDVEEAALRGVALVPIRDFGAKVLEGRRNLI